jgi:hypothetical protein
VIPKYAIAPRMLKKTMSVCIFAPPRMNKGRSILSTLPTTTGTYALRCSYHGPDSRFYLSEANSGFAIKPPPISAIRATRAEYNVAKVRYSDNKRSFSSQNRSFIERANYRSVGDRGLRERSLTDRISDALTRFAGSGVLFHCWFIRQEDPRAHLDLQINLLAEQENTMMLHMLRNLCEYYGIQPPSPTEASRPYSKRRICTSSCVTFTPNCRTDRTLRGQPDARAGEVFVSVWLCIADDISETSKAFHMG